MGAGWRAGGESSGRPSGHDGRPSFYFSLTQSEQSYSVYSVRLQLRSRRRDAMDRGGMWTKLLSQELAEAKKVTSFRAHPAAHTIRPPRPKEPLLHRNQEPELRRHGDGKWHKRFSLLAIWPFFSLMVSRLPERTALRLASFDTPRWSSLKNKARCRKGEKKEYITTQARGSKREKARKKRERGEKARLPRCVRRY